MSSIPIISDEALLIALVRKLRVQETSNQSDQLAVGGTHFDSLFATAVTTSLFKQEAFDSIMRKLVLDGTLVLTGRLSFHDGEDRKIKNSEHGRITTLHPEGPTLEHQFFTENWTPIIAHRSKETNRRLYPLDNMSYYRLKIMMVYIASDGLPTADTPVIYPVT